MLRKTDLPYLNCRLSTLSLYISVQGIRKAYNQGGSLPE